MVPEDAIRVVQVTPFAVSELGEGLNRRLIVEWRATIDPGGPTRIATCPLRLDHLWPRLKSAKNQSCLLYLAGSTIVGVSRVGLPVAG
jgi:hypothetical protein